MSMMALSLPPLSITFKSIEQILGNLTGAGEHERQRCPDGPCENGRPRGSPAVGEL